MYFHFHKYACILAIAIYYLKNKTRTNSPIAGLFHCSTFARNREWLPYYNSSQIHILIAKMYYNKDFRVTAIYIGETALSSQLKQQQQFTIWKKL